MGIGRPLHILVGNAMMLIGKINLLLVTPGAVGILGRVALAVVGAARSFERGRQALEAFLRSLMDG